MVEELLITLQIIFICAITFSWGIQINNDNKIFKIVSWFFDGILYSPGFGAD